MSDGGADEVGVGSDDLADGTTHQGEKTRRAPVWALVVAAVAVIGIAVGAVLVLTSSGSNNSYDAKTEQAFLDACTASGGAPVEPACRCIYAQIVATIPYDRFAALDEDLRAAKDAGEPFVLPEEIQALVPACQIPA